MSRDFRKIEAYQLAIDLAERVYRTTKSYPKHEIFGIVSQMRRAAISIASNIAEGAVRRTIKDYLRFLYIAMGSLAELECQIEISKRLGYLSENDHQEIEALRNKTGGKLFRLIKFIENESQGLEVMRSCSRAVAG